MEHLTIRMARRLALARSGLLKPRWTAMPVSTGRGDAQALAAAHRVITRFGYLQLDTVSIAGARSHTIVLLSRLSGLPAAMGERLLSPGSRLFEYWGHEACWMPLELYPAFAFRRQEFLQHPWWGDVISEHQPIATDLLARIAAEGPLRSIDLEGSGSTGWWDLKTTRRVAAALWSSGELAIRERSNFQRSFDLAERVIPASLRDRPMALEDALETLLLRALTGHGWATSGTLAATWRLVNRKAQIQAALARLREHGDIVPCALRSTAGLVPGWIRPDDLELAARLETVRPRSDRGVLLSPFDPLLWDRNRVRQLFGFEQVLEIYKPAAQRRYGYYCLPVLAGEHLVARFDLKAERRAGLLRVLSCQLEENVAHGGGAATAAAESGLARFADALDLQPSAHPDLRSLAV